MKKALIIWGGWKGHNPEITANALEKLLLENNYFVKVTSDFSVLINEELTNYDVIVPIWSCGIKSKYYLDELLAAVKGGVGLATFHGGINWFEDEEYYKMIGALYLNDTKCEEYTVNITDKNSLITENINDFKIKSEKYYLQVDPCNQTLATADFSGVKIPIAWIKDYGKGRIFYSSLAHDFEEFLNDSNIKLILNGIDWCSKKI